MEQMVAREIDESITALHHSCELVPFESIRVLLFQPKPTRCPDARSLTPAGLPTPISQRPFVAVG
jgi:hypothetical protein